MTDVDANFDAVVVGGGFFGCSVALALAERGDRVLVVERATALCLGASYVNQARVHNGYHYPRSILTGLRSRVNCPRFLADFDACVDRSFQHYYAVARQQSKVTAAQFEQFCQRIGAPLRQAPAGVRRWFNDDLIEGVYAADEYAFDAVKLRHIVHERLAAAKVEVRLETQAMRAEVEGAPALRLTLRHGETLSNVRARKYAFNCTYSNINRLLFDSNLETIPLRHELAEIVLVEPPRELSGSAMTVMCGPYFSTMPFPARGLYSFSHVRYTPHCSWEDGRDGKRSPVASAGELTRKTMFAHMVKDACRYVPMLEDCRYVESLWEVKTVLPQSEANDSRPILFRRDPRVSSFVSVMGGKMDNIYDLPRELDELGSVEAS